MGSFNPASSGYEMCSDAWFQAGERATLRDTAATLSAKELIRN